MTEPTTPEPSAHFASPETLREHLGPERSRTLPEIIDLVLDAAEEDANRLAVFGIESAREVVRQTVGGDLYGLVRQLMHAIRSATGEDEATVEGKEPL